MKNSLGSLIRIVWIGVVLLVGWLFLNPPRVKAGAVGVSSKLNIYVHNDWSISVEGTYYLKNNSPLAVDLHDFSILALPFRAVGESVELKSAGVPVEWENNENGVFIRLAKTKKHYILNPGEVASVVLKAQLKNPYFLEGENLKFFYFPTDFMKIEGNLFIHRDISVLSRYTSAVSGTWRVYKLQELGKATLASDGFLILWKNNSEGTNSKFDFIYKLNSVSSYFLPRYIDKCLYFDYISPQVGYIEVDSHGMFIIGQFTENASSVQLTKKIDLVCIKETEAWSKKMQIGFWYDPLAGIVSLGIGKYEKGEFYFSKNGDKWILPSEDRYGLLWFPLSNCENVEECNSLKAIYGKSKLILLEIGAQENARGLCEFSENYLEKYKLSVNQVEWQGNRIINKSDKCFVLSQLTCEDRPLLQKNDAIILFPRGEYFVPDSTCQGKLFMNNSYVLEKSHMVINSKLLFVLSIIFLGSSAFSALSWFNCKSRGQHQ